MLVNKTGIFHNSKLPGSSNVDHRSNCVCTERFQTKRVTNPVSYGDSLSFLGKKVKQSLDRLRLIYTADSHRNLSRMPGLRTAIESERSKAKSSLTVHSGDYGMGATGLDLQVRLLNKLGIDFATLGNHEFFSKHKDLANALAKTNFQTLLANIIAPETNPLKELFDSKKIANSAIKEVDGKKYGFIGVTTSDLKTKYTSHLEGLDLIPAEKAIKEEIKKLEAQGVNKIVLLSHLGYKKDRQVSHIPGLDVIVGSHTHIAIPGIQKDVNLLETDSKEPVLILHSGAHNNYLGVSDLVFDKQGILQVKPDEQTGNKNPLRRITDFFKKLFSFIFPDKATPETTANKLVKITKFKPDQEIKDIIEKEFADLKPIASIKKTVNKNWPVWNAHEMGSLIADAVKDYVGTDVAILIPGGIKSELDAGPATTENIQDFVLPFKSPLVKVKISGQGIIDALNNGAKSFGRDSTPGIVQVSGLQYTVDINRPEDSRVIPESVMIQKGDKLVPLKSDESYEIAYDKFLLSGGLGFDSLHNVELLQQYDGVTNSIALAKYIEKHSENQSALHPDYESRITVINQPDQSELSKTFLRKYLETDLPDSARIEPFED